MEHYTSFKEIDTRLKILRLQRDISLEQLQLTRKKLKSHFQIPSLSGHIRDQAKKAAVFVAVSFLLRKLKAFKTRKALQS